jgi:hypothetical protein
MATRWGMLMSSQRPWTWEARSCDICTSFSQDTCVCDDAGIWLHAPGLMVHSDQNGKRKGKLLENVCWCTKSLWKYITQMHEKSAEIHNTDAFILYICIYKHTLCIFNLMGTCLNKQANKEKGLATRLLAAGAERVQLKTKRGAARNPPSHHWDLRGLHYVCVPSRTAQVWAGVHNVQW